MFRPLPAQGAAVTLESHLFGFQIVEPGNEAAEKALHNYVKRPKRTGDLLLNIVLGGVMSGVLAWGLPYSIEYARQHEGPLSQFCVVYVLLVMGWAVPFTLHQLATFVSDVLAKRSYDKHVRAGHIILLDPVIVRNWDKIRREAGIRLGAEDRKLQLRKLFKAAKALNSSVVDYYRLQNEPELAHESRRCLATIRARLEKEVQDIEVDSSLEGRRLAELDAEVTEEEVERQLQILNLQQGDEELPAN